MLAAGYIRTVAVVQGESLRVKGYNSHSTSSPYVGRGDQNLTFACCILFLMELIVIPYGALRPLYISRGLASSPADASSSQDPQQQHAGFPSSDSEKTPLLSEHSEPPTYGEDEQQRVDTKG
jgi:hypothetical protein